MFRQSLDLQMTLDDRMLYANKQTRKAVESSRAKMVGDIVYPLVDESRFASLFSDAGSRPNIEIKRYVSALVLKRMYRMPDEMLIEFIRCGALNFQYALHTTQEDTQPLSESSLRRFRRLVEAYNDEHKCDLIKEEFERISKMMAMNMGVLHDDPNKGEDDTAPIIVRMDSMEIEAHAKAMTRIEILYTSIVIVLRYLHKKKFSDIIPDELAHYNEEGDHNRVMYYRVAEDKKAGIQDTRVAETINEMLLLQKAMEDYFTKKMLSEIPEYQIFERVLEEQTCLDENGKRVPKAKENIAPTSVQNPFDETVTYRYKHGQHHGHVLNVAEACDDDGNGVIIYATLEPNVQQDNKLAEEYVKQLPDNGPKQVLVGDGAFNGEELEKLAAQKNVTLQTTSLTGKAADDIFADFVLNEEKTAVLNCPKGLVPVSNKYSVKDGTITAVIPERACAECPYKERCKANIGKKKTSVRVTGKTVARAKQARHFSTEEGKKNACRRNGVEGIMSVMRRKYDVDHIPVFRLERLKNWIWTTLISYNLVKYQKYMLEKELCETA